jgi:hypothetical protein
MKLRECGFETVPDIRWDSQAVLDSIKENDFHGTLKQGKTTRSL